MLDLTTDHRPVVVASHPRSGTHLTIDLLRRQFADCAATKRMGERLDRLYLTVEEVMRADGPMPDQKALRILRGAPRVPVKTHLRADYTRDHVAHTYPGRLPDRWVELLEERARFVYVVRDGRDVLASYQTFARSWDPEARGTIGQFLRTRTGDRSRVRVWADHVEGWLARPEVIVVRFERILGDPASTIAELSSALGLPSLDVTPLLPPATPSIWAGRLDRLRMRAPVSTTTLARSGETTLRWQRDFSPADIELFAEEAGDLLQRLGYPLTPSD